MAVACSVHLHNLLSVEIGETFYLPELAEFYIYAKQPVDYSKKLYGVSEDRIDKIFKEAVSK